MFSTSIPCVFWTRLLQDESGASAVEYGLIVALVAVLAVAGLDTLGKSLGETVSTANSGMRAK